jgi:hypothetical protein
MLSFAGAAQRLSGIEQRLFSIPVVVMCVVVLGGLLGFAMPASASNRRLKHWVFGGAHGAAHLGLGWVGATIWLRSPFHDLAWPWPLVVAALLYVPLSGLVASQIVAAYLLVASAFDVNVNELFAAQGIFDEKSFLRLHIDDHGELTIYPLGVARVGRRWRANPAAPPDRPWLEPDQPLAVALAEDPITLR